MFNLPYEDRLSAWHDFRAKLETSDTPLEDVLEFYSRAPTVSIHTDPYDKSVWPSPWELILENQYDDFCIVLGMCYSLQLTDRFKGSSVEIHIGIDSKKSLTYYLLKIGNYVVDRYKIYSQNGQLPTGFTPQIVHTISIPNK